MQKQNKYKIRNMKREEIDMAVKWAFMEGWNPGIYDSDCFYKAYPKGFFIGLLGSEPIATISAVKYGKNYGFMGFYIVKPKYRGKGYGIKLFDKAFKYLGKRNKGGDGVLENLPKYRKKGLKLAHLNFRYHGKTTGNRYWGKKIKKLNSIDFKKICSYDKEVFGFARSKFLKLWISQPEGFSIASIARGEVNGFGTIRKCFTGYKIGPLFADNSNCANEIFYTLIGYIKKGSDFFFDIPEVNKNALMIAHKNRMKKVFATGRIYTKGQPPTMKLDKWYGVTSFELG